MVYKPPIESFLLDIRAHMLYGNRRCFVPISIHTKVGRLLWYISLAFHLSYGIEELIYLSFPCISYLRYIFSIIGKRIFFFYLSTEFLFLLKLLLVICFLAYNYTVLWRVCNQCMLGKSWIVYLRFALQLQGIRW